jgi:hypothetical protein
LIKNSSYGVAIQPLAVQISKLRFFISLLVEQKTGGTKENNYTVFPLPNLALPVTVFEMGGYWLPSLESIGGTAKRSLSCYETFRMAHESFRPGNMFRRTASLLPALTGGTAEGSKHFEEMAYRKSAGKTGAS